MACKDLERVFVYCDCSTEGEVSKESIETVELLRDYGFIVFTTPIIGLWDPKVIIRGRTYEGIKETREYLERQQHPELEKLIAQK